MSLFLFGSAKGSPGVTTTVLALAARWPAAREPLVVEADPAGGDLVARLASPVEANGEGLRDAPSTVQLAAAARGGLSPRVLLEQLQRLPGPGEVRALVAPGSPFAASTALTGLVASGLGACLRGLAGFDVLVDVGRVDATSPALPLVREAGSLVVVTRPELESVLHTRDLVGSLHALGVRCGLVVIGDRPYTPVEVAAVVGAGLVAVLPDDPTGARALAGEARSPKVVARTRLVRAAGELAARLAPKPTPVHDAAFVAAPATAGPPPPPPPPPPVPPPVCPTGVGDGPAFDATRPVPRAPLAPQPTPAWRATAGSGVSP